MSFSRIPSTIPTISSEKLIKSLSLQARWHVCVYIHIYIYIYIQVLLFILGIKKLKENESSTLQS